MRVLILRRFWAARTRARCSRSSRMYTVTFVFMGLLSFWGFGIRGIYGVQGSGPWQLVGAVGPV